MVNLMLDLSIKFLARSLYITVMLRIWPLAVHLRQVDSLRVQMDTISLGALLRSCKKSEVQILFMIDLKDRDRVWAKSSVKVKKMSIC